MHKSITLLLLLILSACSQAENRPNILEQPRNAPTQPPPDWIQPAEPITLDTVARTALLGRLDNAVAPATIFDHAFAPDGTRLAGLDDQSLAVWDMISGQIVFHTGRLPDVNRVFFSADKTEVYGVESTGLITVYNAETGETHTTFQAINGYTGVVDYAPDAGWLAFGNDRGEIRVWNPLERQAVATISAHIGPVTRLAFADSGDWLASANNAGEVKVWDWANRAPVTTISDTAPALALSFAPDESLLAVGTRLDIRLWSLPDGVQQHTLPTGESAIEIVAFSPDGQRLINAGDTPEMQVWNPQTGTLVARLPDVGQDRMSYTFSPDSTLLLTSELGGKVTLWNMTTMTENTVNRADLDTGDLFIYAVDWTPDSLLLTLFGATGSVYIWGVPPG
jgi:WD40 repeat protein